MWGTGDFQNMARTVTRKVSNNYLQQIPQRFVFFQHSLCVNRSRVFIIRSNNNYGVSAAMFPIFQMSKLRHRGVC